VQFFTLFPDFEDKDFYITGEVSVVFVVNLVSAACEVYVINLMSI